MRLLPVPPMTAGDLASIRLRLGRTIEIPPAIVLFAWAAVCFAFFRPDSIAFDWQGWRQSDTQSIARHFTEPGASLFYPRVDWGGDGPGYVETEMQLYAAAVALVMRVVGDAEWPGQLLSLLCAAGTGYVLFRGLSARFGPVAAFCGVGAFLASPSVVFTATSVQPDALSMLGYTVAWFAFLRFESHRELRWLWLYALFGALAMLVKPTAAQLGVSSVLLLVLRSRDQLKGVALWIAWVLMLLTLVLYLKHALGLYQTYGNTFGVLSGTDSKAPKLIHLLMPTLFAKAGYHVLQWGTGFVGGFFLLAALVRPRAHPAVWALFVGNALWTVVSLRYTSDHAAGPHYNLLSAVMGAYATAEVVGGVRFARTRYLLGGAISAVTLLAAAHTFSFRKWAPLTDATVPVIAAAARDVGEHVKPGALIVVRADKPKYDEFWRTTFNPNDPRIFYLTKTRGWCLFADDLTVGSLAELAARGARYYIQPFKSFESREVDGWLAEHGKLLARNEHGGRLFELLPSRPAG